MDRKTQSKLANSSHQKVAVVVVTSNRKNSLVQNLAAILNGTKVPDRIFLIDCASNDGTTDLLKEKGFLPHKKIEYYYSKENLGSSGGFSKGLKLAYKAGFDWFWTLDDDAIPETEAFANLVKYSKFDQTKIFGSLAVQASAPKSIVWFTDWVDEDGEIHGGIQKLIDLPTGPVVQTTGVSFLGLFIGRAAVKNIGFPREDFFVWADDVEYFTRAKKFGYPYYFITNSLVHHPAAVYRYLNLGYKKSLFVDGAPWKLYYGIRNGVRIDMEYNSAVKTVIVKLPKLIVFLSLMIIFYQDQKAKRARFYAKGLFDGLFNRMGLRLQPGS
jgi:rhamnopyranosyl-N-acetylglucosaminyl-diphospho-decaprenol beta-1,3/1,4-galactofuranosyltransferase